MHVCMCVKSHLNAELVHVLYTCLLNCTQISNFTFFVFFFADGKDRYGDLSAIAALDAEDESARIQRLEQEEGERAAELNSLRQSIEETTEKLAALDRTTGNSQTRIRQLESELERLLAEGEVSE